MPITRRRTPVRSSSAAKPAIIPACVEPVTVHTTIVSNVMPSDFSCSATSKAQLAKPSPPRRCSLAPAGMAYGVPPASSTSRIASFHESRIPMSNPCGSRRESAPIIRLSRMLPTWVLVGSSHGTHFSCTSRHFMPEVRGDGGDLPGVVGLVAADGDERVGAAGEGVGDDVLQLADLVAAVGQAAVDVLALGPDLGAAQVLGQPLQVLDGGGAEGERVALELLEDHGVSWVLGVGHDYPGNETAGTTRVVER